MERAFVLLCSSLLVLACTLDVGGAPIGIPDLRQCETAVATAPVGPPVSMHFNCCLPVPNTPQDYHLPDVPDVIRVRRPAHLAKAKYIAKYERAYHLMRALPATDPRSLAVQANLHCAFCNFAYKQPGTNVFMEIHYSWLFLSWHRWYLHFHERILAKLVGDPKFALLFWNWDNQLPKGNPLAGGNELPVMFASPNSSLYDANRNPAHARPALVRLNVLSNTTHNSVIISENLNNMYQALVTASTTTLFFGRAFRLGMDISNSTVVNAPLGGSIENGVHNAMHFWTGTATPLGKDMGNFATAARDPVFYAHHSNVDRLWEVWTTLPGGRRLPPTDPDFLNTQFVFYDEDGKLVRVRAGDALATPKFGVRYTSVRMADNLWRQFHPKAVTNNSAVSQAEAEGVTQFGAASSSQQSESLGRRFRALVHRASSSSNSSDLEEVLVLQGLSATRDGFVQLRVFVNLPNADDSTPTHGAEFLGSVNILPAGNQRSRHFFANSRLEIGDNLKRIGIAGDPVVVITIVVQTTSEKPFDGTLAGLLIELE